MNADMSNVRLLIVVESADYRAALEDILRPNRLHETLSSRISPVDIHIVMAAAHWAASAQAVSIFSCYSEAAYSDRTSLKVGLMGSGVPLPTAAANRGIETERTATGRQLLRRVAEFCPTHLVMCTRSLAVLSWAIRHGIRSVALLSNWAEPLGWAERRRHARFVRSLNHSRLSWVGGQGVLACKILEASGISAAKVIPWEWSQPQLLHQYPPKTIHTDKLSIGLIYVGPLVANRGVDELLQGTLALQQNGYKVNLQLIRNTLNDTSPVAAEETTWLEEQVKALNMADAVTVWAGLSPEQMLERVRDADIAIIPRAEQTTKHRSKLPLGMALAMAARTPIVACDDERLAAHLYHGANAIIFPTGSPQSMAHRIERIMGQAPLYAQLSESSRLTLDNIKVPARWETLIQLWLTNSTYDQQRLHDFALSSGRYDLPEPK